MSILRDCLMRWYPDLGPSVISGTSYSEAFSLIGLLPSCIIPYWLLTHSLVNLMYTRHASV